MITVENDWVRYETVPVRPVAVRGGAACGQRPRMVTDRPRAAAPVPTPSPAQLRPAAPSAAPVAARKAPRLRLTRRGRIVLVVLPAVLAGTTALVGLTAPFAEAQPVRLASTVVVGTVSTGTVPRTVVVGTGDTLWSIAERIAPQADPRDVVANLERANHLSGATVQAGERLVLPAGVGG
jgi:LysM domain